MNGNNVCTITLVHSGFFALYIRSILNIMPTVHDTINDFFYHFPVDNLFLSTRSNLPSRDDAINFDTFLPLLSDPGGTSHNFDINLHLL